MNPARGTRRPKAFAIAATLVATILGAIACWCLPLGLMTGIPAIVFADKAELRLMQGDEAGSRAAAARARMWMWATVASAACHALMLLLRATGSLDGFESRFDPR